MSFIHIITHIQDVSRDHIMWYFIIPPSYEHLLRIDWASVHFNQIILNGISTYWSKLRLFSQHHAYKKKTHGSLAKATNLKQSKMKLTVKQVQVLCFWALIVCMLTMPLLFHNHLAKFLNTHTYLRRRLSVVLHFFLHGTPGGINPRAICVVRNGTQ